MWLSTAEGNGGGGGRPLFPQWSHHVYPQFLPGSHPNANANANHHVSQHHHEHTPASEQALRRGRRQPNNPSAAAGYYIPNHYSNHHNYHSNNYNYHRHHHYHHHNNNNHHHALQKHIDQPRNIYHRNSGYGLQESGGVMSQSESQDDGEYEVIIVDENNSSILADHDVPSSGPPSTKSSTKTLNDPKNWPVTSLFSDSFLPGNYYEY
ncbi:hypothetical protein TSAR_000567 [Trichomalopsis sarcophagae]|uniref:Uncharacterized protein n=1 Tax=Trichomalopsis sarcophagae TaxID=543379 RepID=A0A232FFS9_9HYME|nr:hypothetical protein TSAR_000567 [Trichomalopsis sarcophagae]